MHEEDTNDVAFIAHAGQMGALMRARDWSATPLGEPRLSPSALRSIVGLLLNSKFPMFVAWGPELTFLYNDAYSDILGKKHPSALGKPFQEVWAEIWHDLGPIAANALQGQAAYFEDFPLLMERKGYREETFFTFSYSPAYDESGRVHGVFCACTETTGKVLAERHRNAENERLRELFRQAPGMMAVMRGPEHTFEFVNDAYLQLIGFRDQIGMPVRRALPELAGQGFFDLLDRVYATGQPFVGRGLLIRLQRTPSGNLEERYVDFIYQPIKDDRGVVNGIFLEGSDVTDAVLVTNALRESENRLRQLANTIPHLAWMANPDGRVHWYNDRWYEFTGTRPGQFEGWEWRALFEPGDAELMTERWREAIGSGEQYEYTARIRSAAGEYRTFFIRAAPLRDGAGNIVQWFGTNTDVTDLQNAQEELQAANRRKDDFLAMLAHELRNPLAPINTAAELLKLGTQNPERVRHTTDVIIRQVEHMTELIDDLLDVSRVTRGIVTLHKEKLDLKNVIADAVEQSQALISARSQHFTLSVPDIELWIEGDRTRLVQVFSNILNNASKYTPDHGRLSLRMDAGDGEAIVTVEDNGIGIPPALLPHVFELFTQAERSPDRSQGGLGLGLALVKSLVELHGGSVAARSGGAGTGSSFTVRLPMRAGATVHPPRPSTDVAASPRNGRLRILVVDDNADAAHTLGMLLDTLGHQVFVEHTAAGALASALGNAPDIVFLDIGLPEMDGYEVARRLRLAAPTRTAVLVALTGYGQDQDKDAAREAGFDHHFVKPAKFAAVQGVISDVENNRGRAHAAGSADG